MKLLVLALLILYDSMLIFQLEHVKALDTMAPYVWESGDFRAMRLGRDAAGRPFLDYEELAMAMLTENFDLTGKKLSGGPLFFPVRRVPHGVCRPFLLSRPGKRRRGCHGRGL